MRPGGCFSAVAATAGERAPAQTNERYAFLRVRRLGALVLGLENHCFCLDFLSPSRIWRKIKHFGPSRDGLCLSFIGHVNVCPFSLSRSPRCSRFVFLVFSSLLYFLLLVFDPLGVIYFPGAAAAAAGRGSPPPPGARRGSVVGLIMCSCCFGRP